MTQIDSKLRAGDWVEVMSASEIAETLSPEGTLDGLPFMPEMIQYCGRRFKVLRWAEKSCFEAGPYNYVLREIRNNDAVLLEGLRCTGADHDGCQRLCLFFWKLAWLRKVETERSEVTVDSTSEVLRSKLRTKTAPGRYFCQSTEMVRATSPDPMKKSTILRKCFRDVRSGAVGLVDMLWLVLVPAWRKLRDAVAGRPWLIGNLTKTPAGTLGLQPGELVEVLSLEEMRQTLDRKGRNRGLICDVELEVFCGKQYRVLSRLDRFISDVSGEMRKMEGTVILEGVPCLCARVVGGCSRLDYTYWREVWLKRVEPMTPVLTQLRSTTDRKPKMDAASKIHELA